MTRAQSYDGDFQSFPVSIRRAAEADRSYYDRARCTTDTGVNRIAWTLEPGKKYKVGSQFVPTDTLLELAALECELCPVQWECATAGIVADEPVGVWGDSAQNLRRFAKHPAWQAVLARAKTNQVPVRRAIAKTLHDIS